MVDGENSVKRYRLSFLLLLAAVFLFRMWFSTTLPLSGDESYHWEWSRNPALGYYDHPPLTAYLIRFCTWVFGRSTELSVRFAALLMLTGTAVLCFLFGKLVVRTRGGSPAEAERAGFIAGLQIMIAPVYAFFSLYISTDPSLIFFWTLTLYLFYRATQKGNWPLWLAAGIAMGLAVMSKFIAFLIAPGFLLFLIISPGDRVWWRRPHPYVACVCTLLVLAPFLWWNAKHDWATFMFNFVYRQQRNVFAPGHAAEFVLVQCGLALTPGIFAFAAFGLWRSARDWLKSRDRSSLFLAVSSIVPLAYFMYVSFRRQVGFHWPAAAWIGVLVYSSCHWAMAQPEQNNRLSRRLSMATLFLCLLVTVPLHVLVHLPPRLITFTWRYRWDKDAISTAKHVERFGWRELGQRVALARNAMLSAQCQGDRGVFVICEKYGLASNVAFYTPGQIKTHLWSKKRTHGENYRFWDDFTSLKGMDAVYVAKRESTAVRSLPELRRHFKKLDRPERVPIVVDGEELRSFFIIRCYDFDGIEPNFGR